MRRVVLFIPLLLALLLGLLLYYGVGKDPTTLESALLGDPVPAFTLPTLHDPQQMLDQHFFKGQVSLLNVWATWCPACMAEHPYLVDLAAQGVRIVGLNYKDDRDAAKQWLIKRGDPYVQNLFDAQGQLGFDLGVYGAPETYLIDAEGRVRYRHVGVVNDAVWAQEIQPLMLQLNQVPQ